MPNPPPTRRLALVEPDCALCGASGVQLEARGFDYEYDTVPDEFEFGRCTNCDHVYLKPRPSEEELSVIYPDDYYALAGPSVRVVADAQRIWEGRKVALYRTLVGPGRRRWLDIGCGNGRFLSVLREFGDPQWELVGVDFDERAVGQCREAGFEAHAVRVEDYDGGGEGLDGVVMLQLIEHVDDPAVVARKVFQLLKPGGCFVVETPNLGGWDYRLFRGQCWGHYHFPRHWNLFSTPALHRMLRDAGFEIESTDYLISTSAWTISLHNWFKSRGYPAWVIKFCSYQNPLLLAVFVVLDSILSKLGRETSNQRVVARKAL